jgi:putative transposase
MGWKFQSPALVKTGRAWSLHVPVVKTEFSRPKKIADQVKDQGLKVCAVDLNVNDALAVCCILSPDGTVDASRFIRGGRYLQHRRKRILGIIATKRAKTGTLQEGIRDNGNRWKKIQAIDQDSAHQVSSRIVEFAAQHDARILVFEHLGNFRPQRGKASRRGNDKRTYWLRGKIFAYSKYKAWEQGIITSRVNPANTSRHCCRCGADVFRYGVEVDFVEPYRPGAPNFYCPVCGLQGSADHMASRNIGLRLWQRYRKPGEESSGLGGSQAGESRGSVDRWGTTMGSTGSLRRSGCNYVAQTG